MSLFTIAAKLSNRIVIQRERPGHVLIFNERGFVGESD